MSSTEGPVAEGLIEFLQATAPRWATKLTFERLAMVRIASEATRSADDLLETLEWALEECVAADKDRRDHDGPDCRSITQSLRGGLRAAIAKAKGEM